MATLNDFNLVDDDDDVMAADVNELHGGSLLSKFKNVETLGATRTLLDADTPFLVFDCNGANRICKMPTANTTTNHVHVVFNNTATGSYTITIKDNAGAVTLTDLYPSEWALMIPNGNGGYFVANKEFISVVSPSQITSNQNNYNPTGAHAASSLRLSTDASRDITGFAFPATYKTLLVHNVGSFNIVLKDESASSTAANRFALNGDLTLSPDQSVLLWYDITSARWRVVGGGSTSSSSGGGLTISIASVTTSNVTGVEETHHVLDVSGMTANRDFNLPTPSASGKRCKVTLSTGDDTYALIVKVNSVEVKRLFITEETLEFISTGTGAANWKLVQNDTIKCLGVMERQTAQSINSSAATKVQLATSVINVGDMNDTTNNKITCRRAGNYEISAFGSVGAVFEDQEFLEIEIYVNGVLKKFYSSHTSTAATNRYQSPSMIFKMPLAVGDYVELYIFHNEGAAQNTDTTYYPQLAVQEI